jgi:hypothetical protein
LSPSTAFRCGLAAFASRRLAQPAVAELRRQPGTLRGRVLPANLLRHSDEQTVAALAAVIAAVEAFRPADDFANWGVVAATRFVGRPAVTQTISRFLNEGPWGVSPHVIPHRSPHSTPGTLSQALALHGPNFAAGGGAGGEAEALLAGVALLHAASLPGVWVVLSRLTPEGDCDPSTGSPAPDVEAHAIALALTQDVSERAFEMEIAPGKGGGFLSLLALEEALDRFGAGEDVELPLDGFGTIALRHAGGGRR